jgi:hypothetical protein
MKVSVARPDRKPITLFFPHQYSHCPLAPAAFEC